MPGRQDLLLEASGHRRHFVTGRDVEKGQAEEQHSIGMARRPLPGGLESGDKVPVCIELIGFDGAAAEKEIIILEAPEQVNRLPRQVSTPDEQGAHQGLFHAKTLYKPGVFRNVFPGQSHPPRASANRRLR